MLEQNNRREFLRNAILAGAAVGGAAGAFSPNRATAIEPIKRDGKPKFKFSLAAYSYRKLLTGKKSELTIEDFIADCAKFGLDGTEPTSYYFKKDFDNEYLRQLKSLAFRLGLTVSGTAIANDFCYAKGPKRDENIAHVKKWIDHAEVLGAPVIRVFAGYVRKGQTADEAHKLIVEGFEECCDYAGKHGVFLALENHGGPTTKIDGMLRFMRDVKSPWFGANLDTGNFSNIPVDDQYKAIAKLAPYALNVQAKVALKINRKSPRVPTDFKRLANILKDSAYRGFIVLEYEEGGNPRVECPKYLDQLREAFA